MRVRESPSLPPGVAFAMGAPLANSFVLHERSLLPILGSGTGVHLIRLLVFGIVLLRLTRIFWNKLVYWLGE
jgi:hypothetical protein